MSLKARIFLNLALDRIIQSIYINVCRMRIFAYKSGINNISIRMKILGTGWKNNMYRNIHN